MFLFTSKAYSSVWGRQMVYHLETYQMVLGQNKFLVQHLELIRKLKKNNGGEGEIWSHSGS